MTARAEVEEQIAYAFDLPVEVLRMSDRDFHWWLHNTEAGRAVLESP